MKHTFLASALLLLALPRPGLDAADEWTLPTAEPRLKEGAGVEIASAQCILCHSVDYVTTQPPLTRDQWKTLVTKMQQKFGAPVNAETLGPLVEYLTKNYGR